ncbi:MAG: hypothetical protein GY851_27590, partial [bacterium]|nr:hypothetical protein [bacterium]
MNSQSVALAAMNEHFAAGFMEMPDTSPVVRWARAVRRRWESETPPAYEGGLLYPCGPSGQAGINRWPATHGRLIDLCEPCVTASQNRIVKPDYSFTWLYDEGALEEGLQDATPEQRDALTALREVMRAECARVDIITTPHIVGGNGYTHSIPDFGRVLREGLDEHARRIQSGLDETQGENGPERADFYTGMADVVAGIRTWHGRLTETLRAWSPPSPEDTANRDRLLAAFERVPFAPARTFFEAFVAYNLVYYLDGFDNPGRLDQELYPYYEKDLATDAITRDQARDLLLAFTDVVCENGGWSAAIGGTTPDGDPGYNDLTTLCIETVHGRHRPNYELRVRDDMPDEVWDAALEALATGCGQPALYNEPAYLEALKGLDLGLTDEDATRWNGGGCSETMIHGCSNVGSLDAGINLPLVLEQTLDTHLTAAEDFESLVDQFKSDLTATVLEIVDDLNRHQEAKALYRPQPMRSLLIDDCIDRGVDFNAGGARYNWSVVNVAGLANVVDSLMAIRELIYDTQELDAAELIQVLASDYADAEPLRRRLSRCPRFGNGDTKADALAATLAEHVFEEFLRHRPWRGGRFMPSCIMFEAYGPAGEDVGATPDGRRANEPIADSIGPHQGRDTHGPTSMLRSVASLPLHLAAGTPVTNLRFTTDMFATAEARGRVRDLVRTYFKMGGMQMQVSVVDQEVLRDALDHPERHENLIVRIGGYSTYFNRLS